MINSETYHRYDFDLFTFLRDKFIVTPKGASILIDAITDRDAYIAGGFAHYVARYVLCSSALTQDETNSYKNFFYGCKFAASSFCDVDLFFRDEQNIKKFINKWDYTLKDSKLMFAKNYPHEKFPSHKISHYQFITKFYGSPKDCLSRFDIANAMVWIDAQSINVVDGWQDLVHRRLLHLNHFSSDWVLQRMHRWRRKYHYEKFTQESLALVADNVKSLVQKLAESEKGSIFFSNKHINKDTLRELVLNDIRSFDPAQLIELSGYLEYDSEQSYVQSFTKSVIAELSRRAIDAVSNKNRTDSDYCG